ncbi:hypothetical protein VTH82DRAFT_8363 [Thermothelomyces myriococcoides]
MKLQRLSGLLLLWQGAAGLRIACNQQWIEHTPLDYAAKHFYNNNNNNGGGDTATLVNGGVFNLLFDPSIDLAANAETQGLKAYTNGRSIRLIGIIVEAHYRLVANRAAGISELADLRGRRIGTMPGTSAEVFVRRLLEVEAGLSWERNDYSTVTGNTCMCEPCPAGSLPVMLQSGQVDGFGIWETAVELGVRALGGGEGQEGGNAVVFQNASVYREVYSLYSTESKLADPAARARIVEYVRALNQTYEVYRAAGHDIYAEVGALVGVDTDVLAAVWPHHAWGPGSLGEDLLDYLQAEDQYLSRVDNRAQFSRADLERFVDASIYEEALQS